MTPDLSKPASLVEPFLISSDWKRYGCSSGSTSVNMATAATPSQVCLFALNSCRVLVNEDTEEDGEHVLPGERFSGLTETGEDQEKWEPEL